jgi:aminopeptidase N
MHTFTDSADGEQYVYTQFEADYCHWMIPVFDQPDLKAKWTFSAVIPASWDCVSNEFVDPAAGDRSEKAIGSIKEAAALFAQDISTYGELKVLPFKESYKISTYLYAICVGPY